MRYIGFKPDFRFKDMDRAMFDLNYIVNQISARLHGPFSLRFILQPILAILLGFRDGRNDVKFGAEPFGISFIRHPEQRPLLFKSLFTAILKPVLIGTLLDAIVQFMLFDHIRPLPALFVGTFVIAIPYIFSRGITNRIFTKNNTRTKNRNQLK